MVVKQHREEYKHLEFKEQQKELGKKVRPQSPLLRAWRLYTMMPLTTYAVESKLREPQEPGLGQSTSHIHLTILPNSFNGSAEVIKVGRGPVCFYHMTQLASV